MLNFKNTNIAFLILTLWCVIYIYSFSAGYIYIMFIALFYLLILLNGVFDISSGFFIKPINFVKTDNKIIALTFDDGPQHENTNKVLKVLEKNNALATFFWIGDLIDHKKDVVQKAVDEGHLICNHSYYHKWNFPLLSSIKMQEEIRRTNDLIENQTDRKSMYFRPPFGIINPTIVKVCKNLDLQIVGWNIRSYDTIFSRKNTFNRIVRKIKPGAIIILHDSLNETHLLLEELFIYLKQIDYKVVRLDKMIEDN